MSVISRVECVEYTGHFAATEPVFADRLRRPDDIYPDRRAAGPQVFAAAGPPGHVEVRSIALHLHTDDGLVGTTMQISAETAHLVAQVLRPLLIGADPMAVERLWDLGYRSSIHGRRGAGMVALSAVDCALWDLRGQVLGRPVHVVLGGPTRTDAPVYASMLGESLQLGKVRERTLSLAAQGHSAFKWFPRVGPQDGTAGVDAIVDLVGTVREAAGPGSEVMLDAWSSWDVGFTVAVARACEGIGLTWIEEPLLADDLAGYRSLRRRLPGSIALAGGEHEYARWGYADLLGQEVLDVLQPDPHWVGGISEIWKVLALISSAGRPAIFHGQSMQCNAAVTFAAGPALVPRMEYLVRLMPLYQHFLADPITPVGGRVAAPTLPGLGMRIDHTKVTASRSVGQ